MYEVEKYLGGNNSVDQFLSKSRPVQESPKYKTSKKVPYDADDTAFTRGLKSYIPTTKAFAYGGLGLGADALERITGVGEGVRDWALDKAHKRLLEAEEYKKADEIGIINSATGDEGDFWSSLAFNLGKGTGSVIESGVAAGIGALGGAGWGAIPALLGKEALKRTIKKEVKSRIRNKAIKRGATAGLAYSAFVPELGSTYTEAVENKGGDPDSLTNREIAKVGITGGVSGGIEFFADRFGLFGIKDVVEEGLSKGLKAVVKQVGVDQVKNILVQGGTEYLQSMITQYGAGGNPFTKEGQIQAGDETIVGGILGSAGGAVKSTSRAVVGEKDHIVIATERHVDDEHIMKDVESEEYNIVDVVDTETKIEIDQESMDTIESIESVAERNNISPDKIRMTKTVDQTPVYVYGKDNKNVVEVSGEIVNYEDINEAVEVTKLLEYSKNPLLTLKKHDISRIEKMIEGMGENVDPVTLDYLQVKKSMKQRDVDVYTELYGEDIVEQPEAVDAEQPKDKGTIGNALEAGGIIPSQDKGRTKPNIQLYVGKKAMNDISENIDKEYDISQYGYRGNIQYLPNKAIAYIIGEQRMYAVWKTNDGKFALHRVGERNLAEKDYTMVGDDIESLVERADKKEAAFLSSPNINIPANWKKHERKLAKRMIKEFGAEEISFSNSRVSGSKYITLPNGEQLRISDHKLPSAYMDSTYDFREGDNVDKFADDMIEQYKINEEQRIKDDAEILGDEYSVDQYMGKTEPISEVDNLLQEVKVVEKVEDTAIETQNALNSLGGDRPTAFHDKNTGEITIIEENLDGRDIKMVGLHELGHKALYEIAKENNRENHTRELDSILNKLSQSPIIKKMNKIIYKERNLNYLINRDVYEATSEAVAELFSAIKLNRPDYIQNKYGVKIGDNKTQQSVITRGMESIYKILTGRDPTTDQEVYKVVERMYESLSRPNRVKGKQQEISEEKARAIQDFDFMLTNDKNGARRRLLNDTKIAVDTFMGKILGTKKNLSVVTKYIMTQQHKAEINPMFRKVWRATKKYTDDILNIAMEATAEAPNLIPQYGNLLQNLKDLGLTAKTLGGYVRAKNADIQAISRPIHEGTLLFKRNDIGELETESSPQLAGVVFTKRELVDRYKLTDRQVRLYREYRRAIDNSITALAKSFMFKLGEKYGVKRKEADKDISHLAKMIVDKIDRHLAEGLIGEEIAEKSKREIQRIHMTSNRLIERGYAPLKRYGRYGVSIKRANGREEFTLHESQLEANLFADNEKQKDINARVLQTQFSEENYKLLEGMSLDAVEIWARYLKMSMPEKKDAVDELVRLSTSQSSALRFQMRRTGVKGYSDDVLRGLSSYVTANARMASANYNNSTINKAVTDIGIYTNDETDQYKSGEIQDEAVKLVQAVRSSSNEASGFRAFLYANFLYGSLAAGALNLSSVPLLTYPVLTKYTGDVEVGRAMMKYMGVAGKGAAGKGYKIDNVAIREMYNAAQNSGVLIPNEYYQFQDLQHSSKAGSLRFSAKKAVTVLGSLFGYTETFNRHITYLTSLEIMNNMTNEQRQNVFKQEGVNSITEFAEKMVDVTQGRYAKDSRPNYGRGIGAVLHTFKQFMFNYVETMYRMPPPQKLRMAGVLMLLGGINSMPFISDLEDIIDTIGQAMGYPVNSRKFRHNALKAVFGDFAKVLDSGVINLTGGDYGARVSFGNMIPATGVFKRTEKDKLRSLLEVGGAGGSYIHNWIGYIGGSKDFSQTMPVMISNMIRAYNMAETGEYQDSRGRKIVDVDIYETLLKLGGFMPTSVSNARKIYELNMDDKYIMQRVKSNFVGDLASASLSNDRKKIREIYAKIDKWNDKYPEHLQVEIKGKDIMRRKKDMTSTLEERYTKRTPKNQRSGLLTY